MKVVDLIKISSAAMKVLWIMKKKAAKRMSLAALARFLGDMEACSDFILARLTCIL